MNAPGPVPPMTTPEPTNRPAPMTPPMAIIVSCRWVSAFFRVGVALIASSDAHPADHRRDNQREEENVLMINCLIKLSSNRRPVGRRGGCIRKLMPDRSDVALFQ